MCSCCCWKFLETNCIRGLFAERATRLWPLRATNRKPSLTGYRVIHCYAIAVESNKKLFISNAKVLNFSQLPKQNVAELFPCFVYSPKQSRVVFLKSCSWHCWQPVLLSSPQAPRSVTVKEKKKGTKKIEEQLVRTLQIRSHAAIAGYQLQYNVIQPSSQTVWSP